MRPLDDKKSISGQCINYRGGFHGDTVESDDILDFGFEGASVNRRAASRELLFEILINGVRCDAEAKLRKNIEDGVHGGF